MTTVPGAEFDVVILGAGSAGENVATAVAGAGKRVAVVESDRVGGTCPFTSCMPTKTLLRSAEVRQLVGRAQQLGAASRALVLDDPPTAYAAATRRRQQITGSDDTTATRKLEQAGVTLIRGHGRIVRPGVLSVAEQELRWHDRDSHVAARYGAGTPPHS